MVEIHFLPRVSWLKARYMVTLVEGNAWWDVPFHVTRWGAKRKARRFERRASQLHAERVA